MIVDDALLDERGWAVLFADDGPAEQYLADAMRSGALAARLAAWEAMPSRTPVEDLLLFEGRARLSQFEEAAAPAERLAAALPRRRRPRPTRAVAAPLPRRRSTHRAPPPAEALVARTAPALADPGALWTELGELEHERGRPDRAKDTWRHLLDRSPRDAGKVEELATVLWDYGETGDALATIEDARRRLGRPTLLAFEAGVLHEEKRDVDGAVREYLAAGLPADDRTSCFCSAFERDQRALRRLSQLAGPPARAAGRSRRASHRLQPGDAADERTLVALLPARDDPHARRRPRLDEPTTGSTRWTIRSTRSPARPAATTASAGVPRRARDRRRSRRWLLARTRAMVARPPPPSSSTPSCDGRSLSSSAQPTREDEVALTRAVMARRAALATTAEDRVTREIERARYLFENGRPRRGRRGVGDDRLARGLLPEGAPRLRAEAERAAYVERAQGAAAAAAEWERLAARYPWSLGILEDRVAFLARAGRGTEARAALEAAAGRAAAGHREVLLERLARESIEAQDLAQAQRAVETMLGLPSLEDGQRLSAAHLLARLQLRRDAAFDVAALAKREEPRLVRPESGPELHAQLARAAALESRWPASVSEWIEALNRRMDRGWLREACTAAERGGDPAPFVSFFDRQRERSPRDVRWAVAEREIRLFFGDEKGALEAARGAIAVRPDRGALWYETADLLARLGRPREGAELLRDWAKTRPGDEEAAGRRSALLAAAGDADGALAVERQALAAYTTASPKDEEHASELRERRGRAARRLLDLGLPPQAWSLLASGPRGDRLLDSGLGPYGEAELALAAGRYLPLLKRRLADKSASADAEASVFAERGRPEQKEEVVAWIVSEILPDPPAAASFGIERVWPFAQQAGLDGAVKVALARRVLARTPGPWSTAPPESFVDAVSTTLIGDPPKRLTPPLDRLWAANLARRERGADLWAFLAPRWNALVAHVRSAGPLTTTGRLDWAAWLDDKGALATWANGAARDPAGLATLSSLMSERRAWDRLWALAARGWDTGPLVAALPEDARRQWFRLWQQPSPSDPDPAVRARGETVERAQAALGRLTAGHDGAADDPVIAALRGPGTIGGILDERGPRWDTDLWGERPAPGWLVLETLARRTREGPGRRARAARGHGPRRRSAAHAPRLAAGRGGRRRGARPGARRRRARADERRPRAPAPAAAGGGADRRGGLRAARRGPAAAAADRRGVVPRPRAHGRGPRPVRPAHPPRPRGAGARALRRVRLRPPRPRRVRGPHADRAGRLPHRAGGPLRAAAASPVGRGGALRARRAVVERRRAAASRPAPPRRGLAERGAVALVAAQRRPARGRGRARRAARRHEVAGAPRTHARTAERGGAPAARARAPAAQRGREGRRPLPRAARRAGLDRRPRPRTRRRERGAETRGRRGRRGAASTRRPGATRSRTAFAPGSLRSARRRRRPSWPTRYARRSSAAPSPCRVRSRRGPSSSTSPRPAPIATARSSSSSARGGSATSTRPRSRRWSSRRPGCLPPRASAGWRASALASRSARRRPARGSSRAWAGSPTRRPASPGPARAHRGRRSKR